MFSEIVSKILPDHDSFEERRLSSFRLKSSQLFDFVDTSDQIIETITSAIVYLFSIFLPTTTTTMAKTNQKDKKQTTILTNAQRGFTRAVAEARAKQNIDPIAMTLLQNYVPHLT